MRRGGILLSCALATQCVNQGQGPGAAPSAAETADSADTHPPASATESEASAHSGSPQTFDPTVTSTEAPDGAFLGADAELGELLCDGSQALRFAVKGVPGGRPSVQLPSLGFQSVYVRGDCRFWIQETHQDMETIRTGLFTTELVAEFARDMRYSELHRFDDLYGSDMDGDGYLVFSDGGKAVWCRGGCYEGQPSAPAELRQMATLYGNWRKRLLALSEDITGPMRVMLVKQPNSPPPDGDCDLGWPFSFDPAPLGQERPHRELTSFLVEDPLAQELRDWWRNNLEHPDHCYPENSGGSFYVQEEDGSLTYYGLSMRDYVPLENDDGLIPLPTPQSI